MTFSDLMRRAVAKIPLCPVCQSKPCDCDEIERKIARQLSLKLDCDPPRGDRYQPHWQDAHD